MENAKTWELLRDLECDAAQGYHMGKPMPAADFIAWTAGWMSKQPGQTPVVTGTMVFH